MTSYFEEFRKTATPVEPEKQTDADVETLVNNQEIKDDVTEMGEVNPNEADISEFDNKLEAVSELIELRETIKANPVATENNPLVDSQIKLLNKMYNLGLESEEGEGGAAKASKLADKAKEIYFSIRHFGTKFLPTNPHHPFKGDLKHVAKTMKGWEQGKIDKFNEKLQSETSHRIDKSGKIKPTSEIVNQIRTFAGTASNGVAKMIDVYVKNVNKIESKADADKVLENAIKSSGLNKLVLELGGFKANVNVEMTESGLKVDVLRDEAGFFNKKQHKVNVTSDINDAIKFLEDSEAGWSDYRKLHKQLESTWKTVIDRSEQLVPHMTDANGHAFDGILRLVKFIGDIYRVVSKALKYPKDYIDVNYNLIYRPYAAAEKFWVQ